jgi:hypothetical protein
MKCEPGLLKLPKVTAYVRLLTDTSVLCGGSIMLPKVFDRFMKMLPAHERENIESEIIEKVGDEPFTEDERYHYVTMNDLVGDHRCGERNVWVDHLGREWHN